MLKWVRLFIIFKAFFKLGKKTSVSGTTLNDNDIAYPCGLIAKSFFNGLMA